MDANKIVLFNSFIILLGGVIVPIVIYTPITDIIILSNKK